MPQARKNPRPRHHRHGQLQHSAVTCRREPRDRGTRARRLRRRVPRSPELCEVAEIGGATCLALRRAPERTFCRVMGLRSTEPLDEIAAFYGDTPWWVSDSHGLGRRARGARLHARLRLDEVHARRRAPARRTATSMSCLVGPASAGRLRHRRRRRVSGCPTGRSRSPQTSSAGPAGRATSRTTAARRPARAPCSSTRGVGWLGFGAHTPGVPRPRRPERDPRRADRGRPPPGLPGGHDRDR